MRMIGASGTRRFRRSCGGMLLVGCAMVGSCSAELTPEEREFYRRSAGIEVGHQTDDVKRQLGEPTRIVDGSQRCRERGGEKEWVYESFETAAGRVQLRSSSVLICISNQSIVIANGLVHQ